MLNCLHLLHRLHYVYLANYYSVVDNNTASERLWKDNKEFPVNQNKAVIL